MFGAKSSGHQQLDVPRYLLKAKFSHPVSWERNFPALRFGNSVIFSQFSIVGRRAAAVVFGLVHGPARSASPLAPLA
jgi:hypothetical protein